MDELREYLGDGVYASFDGYHVVLRANSHIEPTDTICLDPHVLNSLIRYAKYLQEYLSEPEQEGKE